VKTIQYNTGQASDETHADGELRNSHKERRCGESSVYAQRFDERHTGAVPVPTAASVVALTCGLCVGGFGWLWCSSVWSVCPCAPACGPCVSCHLCVPAAPPGVLPVQCWMYMSGPEGKTWADRTDRHHHGFQRWGSFWRAHARPEANTTLLSHISRHTRLCALSIEAASDEAV